jgi:beta-galactosidase
LFSKADTYYTIGVRAELTDGKWHHLAGIYDGSSMSLYVGGQLERSTAATGALNTRTWPVLIGANLSRGGHEWNGLIDDVHIYSYALSEDDVNIKRQEQPPNTSALSGHDTDPVKFAEFYCCS